MLPLAFTLPYTGIDLSTYVILSSLNLFSFLLPSHQSFSFFYQSLRESDREPGPCSTRTVGQAGTRAGRESEKDLDVGAVEELLFGWLKG